MIRPRWVSPVAWAGAVIFTLFFGLPLLWVMMGAVTRPSDLAAGTNFVTGSGPTLAGFSALLGDGIFWSQLRNSAICATVCAALSVAVGCFVGYATTRGGGLAAQVLVRLSLIGYMVSPVALAIPFFVVWTWLGLADSRAGLIVAHLSFALPYGIWSMRGFFAELPRALEERAATDGLAPTLVLWRVILPTVAPGAVTTTLFCFLLSWNEYVFARVLIGSDRLKTLPVGIDDMFHSSLVDWTRVLAAGTTTMVPAVLIVAALQRQLGRGAMSSWR